MVSSMSSSEVRDAVQLSYNPFVHISAYASATVARAVQNFLAGAIVLGSLTIDHACDDDNYYIKWNAHCLGESPEVACEANRPVAKITVANPENFYSRIASSADVGFAESFIAGEFSVRHPDDLVSTFRILILNRDNNTLSSSRFFFPKVGALINTVLHGLNANTVSGSARNIHAHYDLSNDLFGTFLGDSWTYSCAYFDKSSNGNLDSAQHAKLDMIIRKARITKDCNVLEIGTGWGEFAIRASQSTGCRVLGITLSSEQLLLARKRAADAGVSENVKFELLDYRELPKLGEKFDRVVSIEMLEAVGDEFLHVFFNVVEAVTLPSAVAVIQVITMPEERYTSYLSSVDFIQKHIFPGGICPSLEAIMHAMAKGSRYSLEHAENIGPHYATTLKEWRRRFIANVENGKVALAGFDEFFVRKWIYYLCYCEAGFSSRTLGNMQLVFSRPSNVITLGGPPNLLR